MDRIHCRLACRVLPVPGGSVPVVDATVAASWVAVAGTLGGVVVGGGLDWVRSARAGRKAEAARRDELYVSLLEARTRLQAGLGRLQAVRAAAARGAQAGQGDTAAGEAMLEELRAAGSEAAGHLREVVLASVRLSLTGDEHVRRAAAHLAEAAGDLIAEITWLAADLASEPPGFDHAGAMKTAAGELARAREVATAPWWRRRRLRRELVAARGRTSAPDAS